MAGKSMFGRDDDAERQDDQTPGEGSSADDAAASEGVPEGVPEGGPEGVPEGVSEGVRLIEPAKAAEVAGRDTTAKRRGGDIPKYGDRPASPPSDKKATIRLPLPSGSSDLGSMERPKVAPVTRPAADGSAVPTQVSIGAPTVGETGAHGAASRDAPEPGRPETAEPEGSSRRRRRKERKLRSSEPAAGGAVAPVELERVDDPGQPERDSKAGPAEAGGAAEPEGVGGQSSSAVSGSSDDAGQLVLSIEPPTGEVALPHWTEPATGEVPKVIVGNAPDSDSDQAAWDSFAGKAGSPRYRDQHDDWDTSITDLLDDEGDRPGALSEPEDDHQTQDEFLNLEDVDIPDLEMPKPPTRGSVRDPVRQGKAGRDTTGSTPVVRATKKIGKTATPPRKGSPREPGSEERSARKPVRRGQPTGDNKTVVERLGVAAPSGPEESGRNLKLAVGLGLAMAAGAWALFAWGPRWLGVILITAVAFFSGAEFLAAVGTRRFKPVLPVAWAAFIALPIATFLSGEVAIPLVLFLAVFFSFLWYVLGLAQEKPLGNLGVTFFGILWVGVFGSFASLIFRIGTVRVDGVYTNDVQGPSILIMAIAAAELSDAGALLWGKLYGKRNFSPISPNKTIEGLIGGVLTAVVLLAIGGVVWGPFSVWGDIFFALCCAVAAPIGDLAESLIKRDIGLKDMSDLIPGHGGVLDRMDSLLFVLPVAYFATRMLFPDLPYM